jgi:universal stress protein A
MVQGMYRHILFASDLSEANFLLIPQIKQLAELFNADLTLLHVIEPPPTYCAPALTIFHEDIMNAARESVQRMAHELGLSDQSIRIEMGSVKYEVVHAAQQFNVDAIILGKHGHHGLAKWVGSAIGFIIQDVHCDVITLAGEASSDEEVSKQ